MDPKGKARLEKSIFRHCDAICIALWKLGEIGGGNNATLLLQRNIIADKRWVGEVVLTGVTSTRYRTMNMPEPQNARRSQLLEVE